VPEHDGYALDSILPGKSKEYKYFNDHAATYWYHDHQYMMTAHHNYMGLAGMYIVQDEVEDRLPLPKGDYDVPLLIADRTFNPKDYSLCFNPDSDTILVNGAPWPRMEVANRKYRFRILNGSISTAYQLALEPGKQFTKQFTVIGTDAGLMSKPVEVFSLRIGPAERYEVIIDFSKYSIGTKVELQNLLGLTDAGVPDPTFSKIMRFDVVREEKDNTVTPNTLRNDIQLLAPAAASVSSAALRPSAASTSSSTKITFRDFLLDQDSNQKWVINGKGFDPKFFAAEPNLGDTEIWQFRNTSFTDYHLVHLHLVKFTILERRGVSKDVLPDADKNGVLPYEHNPKDTVFLDKRQQNGPETSVKLLVKFEKHTGKYMFHCHVLDHEDCDMMSQFCVKPSDCKVPIPIP